MIDNILKIEKTGKILLRFGMIAYFLFIGTLNFNNGFVGGEDLIQTVILLLLVVGTSSMLLLHFKFPKIGAIGGGVAALLFLITVVYLGYLEISEKIPFSMIFLHIIKDILLFFATLILTGESLKEMVREKITKPFPVR
ncbi:hypothetical protein MM213_18035 [Belliella sp. R4-6]|uniref:Uncharacterized protein n=1 Tax=Belliella alkalica TaxID=1730871 RepID=A0ABS9VHF7_9BACT|nr:hypothetical protein [Belliella alkalica]MCH7415405.1 hypothetical protein [Belliella alkalica]